MADALHALEADAATLQAASRASNAAEHSLSIARHQLDLRSVSYLSLASSEQAYQQALMTQAQARANRLTSTVALFQALGGAISP